MNFLMYITWLLGPLLEAALLVVMVRGGARSRFPRFFAYILFQVLKSLVLFVVYQYYADNYFYAYWTGNALSVLLSLTVLDEIWLRPQHAADAMWGVFACAAAFPVFEEFLARPRIRHRLGIRCLCSR
jgi:hypothetical protein